MNNRFKNTYIKLKESDKTVKRIKEIANKYSQASGCELEDYLLNGDFEPNWDYIAIDDSDEVTVLNSTNRALGYKEITEEDLDNYLSHSSCFHDGAISMNKEDDVTKWACFQEVADVIGEEAAKFELEKIRLLHLEGCNELELGVDRSLPHAFFWIQTPQGDTFWRSIDGRKVPDGYKQKPFKPALHIDDVTRIKEPSRDRDSIGSLVEDLYTIMPPSDAVTISVRGNGQIVLKGNNIPAIEVTQLEAEEITKAYEAMVLLEGLLARG